MRICTCFIQQQRGCPHSKGPQKVVHTLPGQLIASHFIPMIKTVQLLRRNCQPLIKECSRLCSGFRAYRDLHACCSARKGFVIGLLPHSWSGTTAAVYEIDNIRRCDLGALQSTSEKKTTLSSSGPFFF